MANRSEKRKQFLIDVMVTAVESSPYTPWFAFREYDPERGCVAVYHDKNDDGKYSDGPHKIDLDGIAHGLKLFREAWANPPTYHSPVTNKDELMYSPRNRDSYRYQMLLADDTNGDDGDFDVTTADAVMQFAVLGEEIYS